MFFWFPACRHVRPLPSWGISLACSHSLLKRNKHSTESKPLLLWDPLEIPIGSRKYIRSLGLLLRSKAAIFPFYLNTGGSIFLFLVKKKKIKLNLIINNHNYRAADPLPQGWSLGGQNWNLIECCRENMFTAKWSKGPKVPQFTDFWWTALTIQCFKAVTRKPSLYVDLTNPLDKIQRWWN